MIRGITPQSFSDYPGKLCRVYFTGGCNFRCPWCHNPKLLSASDLPEIPEADALQSLQNKIGKLDAVCVTGGEPLLWGERLFTFLKTVKEMGFLVKLDTNGSNPQALSRALDEKLADSVAIDLKNIPARYGETVGIEGYDPSPVLESLHLIFDSGVESVMRTTVVPGLVDPEAVTAFSKAEFGRETVLQEYLKPSAR